MLYKTQCAAKPGDRQNVSIAVDSQILLHEVCHGV